MFIDGQQVNAKVYVLKHNDVPIYIGCTTNSLHRRITEHYAYSKTSFKPLYTFLKDHEDVVIELVEEVKYVYDKRFMHRISLMVEEYWIKEYVRKGHRLLNIGWVKEKVVKGNADAQPKIENAPTSKTVIASNLKDARKLSKLTQEKAAENIGIKRSLLAAYEEGRAQPHTELLFKFCELYGIEDIKEMFVYRYNIKSKSAKAA